MSAPAWLFGTHAPFVLGSMLATLLALVLDEWSVRAAQRAARLAVAEVALQGDPAHYLIPQDSHDLV